MGSLLMRLIRSKGDIMAVKLVKKGPKTFSGHCHECGCDFIYEWEDLQQTHRLSDKTVDCPQCKMSLTHRGENGTRW